MKVKVLGFLAGFLVSAAVFGAVMFISSANASNNRTPEWHYQDAINVVSYEVWDRASSCNLDNCYTQDPVLNPFASMYLPDGSYINGAYAAALALRALGVGTWYAEAQEDGITWLVWVTFQVPHDGKTITTDPLYWSVSEISGYVTAAGY
jgi:hypothetical protein